MDNSTMRDMILRSLKKEEGFKNMVTAELNGNYFSAADIALPDSESNREVYRIGRNGLEGLAGLRNRSIHNPILLTEIKQRLKQEINSIILEEYPEVAENNRKTKEKAIAKNPYLAKFIRENDDTLVTEDSLIKEARKKFGDAKESVKKKFEKLLKEADINADALSLSVTDVSEIAAAELGEYIQYREKIIRALEAAIPDIGKKEAFIHNIFMPKGMSANSKGEEIPDYAMTNLWLLDDKFMTFSFAASDSQIKTIVDKIEEADKRRDDGKMGSKKPDMVVLYNKATNKDAVLIEFKGLNATLGEKEKSIAEIGRNIGICRESISELNSIWGYIITTIDDEFSESLENNDYKKMYSNSVDGRMYYRYYEKVNAHIFAIDMRAITADAFARNKTFLDILKK